MLGRWEREVVVVEGRVADSEDSGQIFSIYAMPKV